jgi:hypothetical protein
MAIVLDWGTGRKDFSRDIEESVLSIPRSHQYRTVNTVDYDLAAFDWLTIELSDLFGPMFYIAVIDLTAPVFLESHANFMAYELEVSYDANVLIKAYFGQINIDGTLLKTGTEYGVKYGYGKVKFSFPTGFLISKTDIEEGWYPMIAFVPGGYICRVTTSYIEDTLA